MINMTMWVLCRNGEVWADRDGPVLFNSRAQAMVYCEYVIPDRGKGWNAEKVKVTDAK